MASDESGRGRLRAGGDDRRGCLLFLFSEAAALQWVVGFVIVSEVNLPARVKHDCLGLSGGFMRV